MKIKRLLVFVLALQLSACSTFSFLYDHLPFFISWRMNSLFDLDEQQEELVVRSTKEIQDWLKEDAFHVLIADLKAAKKQWQANQFSTAVDVFDRKAQKFIDDFLREVSPHLIALLMTLNSENTSAYLDNNREKSDDWFDYAESKDKKVESRIERLENWFGELSLAQEKRVGEIVTLLPREQAIRFENNQFWVNKVIEASLLRNQTALENWLDDTSIWWHADYKDLRDKNRAQTLALIEMMLETMTPDQQQHVVEVIDEWIEKLEDIYS